MYDKTHLLPPLCITPPFFRNCSYGANTTQPLTPLDSTHIAICQKLAMKSKFIAGLQRFIQSTKDVYRAMYNIKLCHLRTLFTGIGPSDLVTALVMSRAESASVSDNYTSKAFDGEALWTVVRKSVGSFPCVQMSFRLKLSS